MTPCSILDTDLYKLTMQQAVLEHYPDAVVTYQFTNRGGHTFGTSFRKQLQDDINCMSFHTLKKDEKDFLESLDFFKPQYIEYLANYRFKPDEVTIESSEDLSITIRGPWHSAILWEVPLMALISELYFVELPVDNHLIRLKAKQKGDRLAKKPLCKFAEFGTRRRRSTAVQQQVLLGLITSANGHSPPASPANHLVGTSNVRFAMDFNLRPIGTMAHEWVMGVSALEGLRHANRFALYKWKDTYKADLGIALTDTFGTQAFFNDFNLELAKVYDGVRHDSGDPFKFGESVIEMYQKHKIDPISKTIVFSDGLNIDKCIELQDHFNDRIKIAFGIGTHLTNDFDDAKALNMVIKLRTVNDIPVVKLSDEPGKETGDPKAIEIAKWTFGSDK